MVCEIAVQAAHGDHLTANQMASKQNFSVAIKPVRSITPLAHKTLYETAAFLRRLMLQGFGHQEVGMT